jgi:putative ABC transport system permease protein
VRRLRAFLLRLVDPLRRSRRERVLDEELDAHLALHVDENRRRGMSEDEARRVALITLGGLDQAKERYRDRRGLPLVDALRQDVGQAFRAARGNPGFTAVAIATLALGVGSVAIIYSVVRDILLDPFPYVHSDRMVDVVLRDSATTRILRGPLPAAEFLDYQEQARSFEAVLGTVGGTVHYVSNEGAERMSAVWVTPNMFSFLGVAPLAGRAFTEADGKPSAPCVAELNHRTWVGRLGADPGVIGRTVQLDRQPCTIIGIMPPRFEWHTGDLWIPSPMSRSAPAGPANSRWFQARLAPGVSIEAAEAELNALARHRAAVFPLEYPKNARVQVITVIDWVVGRFRPVLYTLFAAVGLLLLIACANVANMLLARGSVRERELLVRVALGASRGRIVRQLVFENLLLAIGGGIGGSLLAWGGIRALAVWMPRQNVPWETTLRLDGPVLVFGLATAMLSTLLFGLYPAIQSTRRDVAEMTTQNRGGSATRRQTRIRGGLVAIEVALSVILLLGTAVLVRNFKSLLDVNLGFDPTHLVMTRIAFAPGTNESIDERMRMFRELLDRVGRLPGVSSAVLANGMAVYGGLDAAIAVTGRTPDERPRAFVKCVTEGYRPTIGLPLLAGRDLTRGDLESHAPVAVVNQAFVRRYFGEHQPLGLAVGVSTPGADEPLLSVSQFVVVGVVQDVINDDIREPVMPEAYVPLSFYLARRTGLTVRTVGDPSAIAGALRREARAVDVNLALSPPVTLTRAIYEQFYAQPGFVLIVLGMFAVTGLLLIAVGIYGVLAYTVSQQTREIAIRLAIGGEQRDVLRLVMSHGLRQVGLGVAIGLMASFGTNRLLESQLWRTSPHDPAALTSVLAVIGVVSVAACLVPALRAMHIEPMAALRQE